MPDFPINHGLFDDIFEALVGPVLIVDLERLTVIRANFAAEALFGYAHGSMTGLALKELAADAQRAGDFLVQRRSFVPLRYIRRSDGLHVPVEIRIRYTESGDQAIAVAAYRESATQLQTRQRDNALELQYQALFEAAPYPIVLLSGTGTVLKANPCATALYGHGESSWSSLSLAELIPSLKPRVGQLFTARPTFIHATEHLRADGSYFMAESTLSYLRLNQHAHAIMIVRDVTEQHATLLQLRAAEERWRFALEGADDEVWDWDVPKGKVETSSYLHGAPVGGDTLRQEKDAQWMNRVHPEDRSAVRQALDACLRGNTPLFSAEFRLSDTAGQFRWNAARGKVMLRDESGKPRRMIGTFRDIHEIKLRAELGRRQQNELAHAGRLILLGEMASMLAHELNQPLTALNNFSSLCLQGLAKIPEPEATPLRRPLEMIRDQARRAGDIIHRVRGFVRKGTPRMSALDLNALILRVLEMTEFEIRESGIQVCTSLEPALPYVMADRVQIEQVVVNLIKNGLDAMKGTPENRRLTVISRRLDSQQAEVRVRDEGIGFQPGERDLAFELFRTSKPDGLGLGLSICRSIIEAHRGQLYIDSPAQGGAELVFHLPLSSTEKA